MLVESDIKRFLKSRGEDLQNGRAIARILHGIGSPCYPMDEW